MGPFITTYTGKKFYFDDITPDQIDIEDIAHSLSMICRFMGHSHQFYSVAQHSLLIDRRIVGPPGLHLAALLHDAAEAYVNDLATPLKKWLHHQRSNHNSVSSYGRLHDNILLAIYQKFGVFVDGRDCLLVEHYDAAATVFEAEAFLGLAPDQLEDNNFNPSLRETWVPWEPALFAREEEYRYCPLHPNTVARQFLLRFDELLDQQRKER